VANRAGYRYDVLVTARDLFALGLRLIGLLQLTLAGSHFEREILGGPFAQSTDWGPMAWSAAMGLLLLATAWPLAQVFYGRRPDRPEPAVIVRVEATAAYLAAFRLLAVYLVLSSFTPDPVSLLRYWVGDSGSVANILAAIGIGLAAGPLARIWAGSPRPALEERSP